MYKYSFILLRRQPPNHSSVLKRPHLAPGLRILWFVCRMRDFMLYISQMLINTKTKCYILCFLCFWGKLKIVDASVSPSFGKLSPLMLSSGNYIYLFGLFVCPFMYSGLFFLWTIREWTNVVSYMSDSEINETAHNEQANTQYLLVQTHTL